MGDGLLGRVQRGWAVVLSGTGSVLGGNRLELVGLLATITRTCADLFTVRFRLTKR